jgi:methanogenic corrinoid protein MtbC1
LPDASPQARGLARAAMSLDAHEATRLLRDCVRTVGVLMSWETMVMPVLAAIGERWQRTGEGVEVEHTFSEAVLGVLRGVCADMGRPRNTRPVLLCCAEGDYHTLPLHALAAALAEEGIDSRMLGNGMPAKDLVASVRRCGPAVVFLFARMPVEDATVLEELPRQRPTPRVIVGGQGWDPCQLPGGVLRVSTLSAAVGEVVSAVHV